MDIPSSSVILRVSFAAAIVTVFMDIAAAGYVLKTGKFMGFIVAIYVLPMALPPGLL